MKKRTNGTNIVKKLKRRNAPKDSRQTESDERRRPSFSSYSRQTDDDEACLAPLLIRQRRAHTYIPVPSEYYRSRRRRRSRRRLFRDTFGVLRTRPAARVRLPSTTTTTSEAAAAAAVVVALVEEEVAVVVSAYYYSYYYYCRLRATVTNEAN